MLRPPGKTRASDPPKGVIHSCLRTRKTLFQTKKLRLETVKRERRECVERDPNANPTRQNLGIHSQQQKQRQRSKCHILIYGDNNRITNHHHIIIIILYCSKHSSSNNNSKNIECSRMDPTPETTTTPPTPPPTPRPALVFGANSEEGRAVVEGLVDAGYDPVYAFTRETTDHDTLHYLQDGLGATVYHGDLQNALDVAAALTITAAPAVFLVTTTELPTEIGQTSGFSEAAENEYQVIVSFFQTLVRVYQNDKLARHVVFSVRDNVQACNLKVLEETGDLWISPLEDGSIVPHFTAKGKGGEYAVQYLQQQQQQQHAVTETSSLPPLRLTLLTMPFFYSNFLGFFAPLHDETDTQWMLTACFGDGSNKIDMMGASDLAKIVRTYKIEYIYIHIFLQTVRSLPHTSRSHKQTHCLFLVGFAQQPTFWPVRTSTTEKISVWPPNRSPWTKSRPNFPTCLARTSFTIP